MGKVGGRGGDVFQGKLDIFTFKINSTLNFNEKKKGYKQKYFSLSYLRIQTGKF